MSKMSEATREREAFRYGHSLLADSVVYNGPAPPEVSLATASSDATLTAFAQLGALRLKASRVLISLFDRQYQHVVAEATPSNGLGAVRTGDGGHGEAEDSLWLSGAAIPRSYGICERVLADEAHPPPPSLSTNGSQTPTSKVRVSIVPDLAADRDLAERPLFAARSPAVRFYAGVPIRSRRGIDIGVYGVLSSEPHHDLDPASVSFLQAMSETVMLYLETVAACKGHQRNVRMVRGLGSLVEGKGSMSKWWLGDNTSSFSDSAGGEGYLNIKQQGLQRLDEERRLEPDLTSPAWHEHPSMHPDPANAQTTYAAFDGTRPRAQQSLAGNTSGSDTTLASGTSLGSGSTSRNGVGLENDATPRTSATSGSVSKAVSTAGTTSDSVTQQQDDEGIVAVRALFSRGANIVRESVECEGVLFLDAAIGSFGGLVGQSESDTPSSGESARASPGSSGEEVRRPSSAATDQPVSKCKILGYSTSDLASIDGDPASLAHLSVPERFLKRLLRRYPTGHIFNFDDSGAVQSEDSTEEDSTTMLFDLEATNKGTTSTPRRRKMRPLRPSDGDILTSTFIGARSIALIPIWDSHKERWFAGGFVWTRTPTRVFTSQGEMSFLKAFGMTIMAEVARIDALRANKAKADVLGSVSHELRSPLHGIILGIELFNETKLDAFQEDILHTLDTCGRTLVDTINHLLDFSKINRYVRVSRRRATSRSRGISQEGVSQIEAGMMNLYADIGLDSLVEEVVESVYAGFSYQQLSGTLGKGSTANMTEVSRANAMRSLGSIGPMDNPQEVSLPSRTTPVVAVYLNIDPSVRWMFYAQPGALRRVIMNLFGNALKYTSRGFIIVSLTQDSVPKSGITGRRTVTLSISDSGKGISADYLKNQLFTPFAQEDHLAAGVGLGLSLVKQIVNTLGGRINVESQVRRGTTVRVTFPLRRSRPEALANATPAEANFSDHVEELKSATVCIVGFSNDTSADNLLSSSASPKATMERICRDWLNLELLSESEAMCPTFYLCTQDFIDQVPNPSTSQHVPVPVVVVCHSASAAHELVSSYQSPVMGRIYEFISQPVGARKLARILASTLKKWGETPPPQYALDGTKTATIITASSVYQPAPSAEIPGPLQGDGAGLLLVDDNLINLKVLTSYMKKLRRVYDTAQNGLEALEAYRQNPDKYRCILMDISMPVMDGLESSRLIRELEQQHKLAPTLIIALTGLASASVQEDAFASGIDIFLTKPVSFAELGRILEKRKI